METENIKEGLKLALSNGEPLEKAMQSFYNAGYKKEDIEEAARFLKNPFDNIKEQSNNSKIPSQVNEPNLQTQGKGQVVSNYEEKKENPKKTLVISVILILFFLAAIVFVLLKRESIVIFINNLIGQNA